MRLFLLKKSLLDSQKRQKNLDESANINYIPKSINIVLVYTSQLVKNTVKFR